LGTLTTAALTAGVAFVAWQAWRNRDGAVLSQDNAFPAAKALSPAEQARIPRAYRAVEKACAALGYDSDAIVQYVFANGGLETGWGTWSFVAQDGSKVENQNNWGAIHCKASDPEELCSSASDKEASGDAYPTRFRRYASPEEGAKALAVEILRNRPQVLRALRAKNPSLTEASLAMRRTHYYAGFCPRATDAYGKQAAVQSMRQPDADEGTKACTREAVETHARTVAQALASAMPIVGKPIALRFGDYDQALRRYREREGIPS